MIIAYANNDKAQLTAHFNAQEFRCKCGQAHEILIDNTLISKLEQIFTNLNCSKIIVTSGYRCAKHDKAVGGSGSGQHTKGTAADIICYGQDGQPISSKKVCCAAQDAGLGGIANINTAYTATHVDTRENCIWFGDEVVSTSYSVTDDFYGYYGIAKNETNNTIITKGIDVSYAQGKIDWDAVKASGTVDFVLIRAGYGRTAGQIDAQFERNYSECRRLGIPVGLYWYSYAMNAEEALQEAALCLKTIAGKKLDYPLYIDIEEPEQLNEVTLNTVADAFCKTVSSAGHIAGLYCSTSYINEYLDNDFPYELWIAQYNRQNTCKFPYGIWQYGIAGNPKFDTFGTGSVPGVIGQCDLDYCYKSYANTTSPDDSEDDESDVLKEILKHVRSIDEKI
jgi:GH25 family lysozyme M1 (1,4-beta-N-acetylmuramidase)